MKLTQKNFYKTDSSSNRRENHLFFSFFFPIYLKTLNNGFKIYRSNPFIMNRDPFTVLNINLNLLGISKSPPNCSYLKKYAHKLMYECAFMVKNHLKKIVFFFMSNIIKANTILTNKERIFDLNVKHTHRCYGSVLLLFFPFPINTKILNMHCRESANLFMVPFRYSRITFNAWLNSWRKKSIILKIKKKHI